jgi:IS1 family transposase
MASHINMDKKIACIGALCEGASIRSTARLVGTRPNTVMDLAVRVGTACAAKLEEKMCDLALGSVQIDEIWSYIFRKRVDGWNQRKEYEAANPGRDYGDIYTIYGIDADTKLIPAYTVGKRDLETARAFMGKLNGCLKNKPQINTDAFAGFVTAVREEFGDEVDYATIVKTFTTVSEFPNLPRYFAPRTEVCNVSKSAVSGNPDLYKASTSYVERNNATMRLLNKRLSRATLAFSKKRENFEASMGLQMMYHNFIRVHKTVKATPAQAYGMETAPWKVGDLVALSET